MKTFITDSLALAIGDSVTLSGWVHGRRTMGKLIFFDLRDSTGLMQIVCVPQEMDAASFAAATDARSEYVVSITGVIQERGAKQINAEMPTGKIEVLAKSFSVINKAQTPPFEVVNEERQANEELRLQYRYLDLRHERMAKNIRERHRVIHYIRNYLAERGFVDIQTPILSKSTPEGARDYLVPSRLHKGKFFALPQSPQQYKQLLMVAGFERYFQIAPCFRDEDARADRSPGEFYQLDIELSFVSQEDILTLAESLFTSMVHELFHDKRITSEPWPRLTHTEAMQKYGSDKPDLRKHKDDGNELAFAWVTDFPLFVAQSEEDHFHGAGDTWAPSHHMFTAPHPDDVALLDSDPGTVRGLQHDLVLNGYELGGGSVRIHDPHVQKKVFDLIGFSEEQKQQFQHLLRAFEYGVPPHGGIAPGLDRLMMILMNEKNLREVTAFPLTTDGRDPMMDAPSEVEKKQLDELGLGVKEKS